jgi:hypothetical protein
MKKVSLFIGLIMLGLAAHSQDLQFTKGDNAPGKIKNGRAYEDFISGRIKVTDNAGNTYSFVKAEFTMTATDGKKLKYTLTRPAFSGEQATAIIIADNEGTVYSFTNVIVKDGKGNEFTLTEVKYEFPSIARN